MWIGAAIAVGGAILKTWQQSEQEKEQEEQLELEEDEERLASINQSLRANNEFDRLMGRQRVINASSGIQASGFAPLELKQFQDFSQDRNAINLNLEFKEYALDSEMQQVQDAKFWSPILNLFQAGEGIWNTYYGHKTPQTKISNTSRTFSAGKNYQHDLVNP